MNGVHDMGGMHGFGPIEREENEPLFHAAWEARVLRHRDAGARQQGYFTIDAFRYGIERMAPAAVPAGVVLRALARVDRVQPDRAGPPDRATNWTPGSSSSASIPTPIRRPRHRSAPPPRAPATPAAAAAARAALRGGRRGGDPQRPPGRPHPAAALRARQAGRHPARPRAADLSRHQRARAGRAAAGRSTTSASTARELWGDSAEPRQTVSLDLWESYLEPAPRLSRQGAAAMPEEGCAMTYDPEQEPYVALRTKALESLLIEKGLLSAEAVDERISEYEQDIGPLKGAQGRRPRLGRSRVQGAAAPATAPRIAELGLPGGGNARRGREHADRAQHGRLHALLVLPLDGARAAADLVQELRLPLARRDRAARGAARVRAGARRGRRRSTSGTAAPRCATWCCRSARPAPRG